jgi:hypothetical protein
MPWAGDPALVRSQATGQQSQQSRLAGAVQTDQTNPVARVQAKGDALEDRFVAK